MENISYFKIKAGRYVRGLLLLSTVTLASCVNGNFDPGSIFAPKYSTEIRPDVPPDVIYNEGLANLRNGDYGTAVQKFTILERAYTYSEWGRKALLMEGYTQYLGKKYDEAVGTAGRYVQLYPTSTETAYAYYLSGMCYYNQLNEADFDQESTLRAAGFFAQLIDKYPKSIYTNDAKFKLLVARDLLATSEMKIGRYYMERNSYAAALNRFYNVVGKYHDTRHIEEALYRLVEIYLRVPVDREAVTAAAILGYNYPQSKWYKLAYKLISDNHLLPKDNKDTRTDSIYYSE